MRVGVRSSSVLGRGFVWFAINSLPCLAFAPVVCLVVWRVGFIRYRVGFRSSSAFGRCLLFIRLYVLGLAPVACLVVGVLVSLVVWACWYSLQ